MIKKLRKSGIGCSIGGQLYGILFFADDIVLLSGSRNGLQSMVDICHTFVKQRNLKFGTNENPEKSKTKCIMFGKKVSCKPKPVKLNGVTLPWVQNVKHLGNTLQQRNDMSLDMSLKKSTFIGRVNSLLQEFHYASTSTLLKAINSFATCFPGAQLWKLFGQESEKVYKCWNVMIRQVFKLDRCTHRCMIEPLSKTPHLKTLLVSRLVKFYQSLLSSRKMPVKFLARLNIDDKRTVFGKNVSNILKCCGEAVKGFKSITKLTVHKHVKYSHVNSTEIDWKVDIGNEILKFRSGDLQIEGFYKTEIEDILKYVCFS